MSARNSGLIADPLFVGLTRPPLRFGVTDAALIANAVLTLELFLVSKQLLVLLVAAPIHGVCALLCAREVRFFELALLWMRTRLPAYLGNFRHWRSSSHCPLLLDIPDARGRRRLHPTVRVAARLHGADPASGAHRSRGPDRLHDANRLRGVPRPGAQRRVLS